MISSEDLETIKKIASDVLEKMTLSDFSITADISDTLEISLPAGTGQSPREGTVELNIVVGDPQLLIGQNGQTLIELERILRMLIHKKLQKNIQILLDINNYKKKKIEYLKVLARELADQVSITKEKKIMTPMSSYERRIVHAELANRSDITTQSEGDGLERSVVISPVF